jgi:hypothetical protein
MNMKLEGACPICAKSFPRAQLHSHIIAERPAMRHEIMLSIQAQNPHWIFRDRRRFVRCNFKNIGFHLNRRLTGSHSDSCSSCNLALAEPVPAQGGVPPLMGGIGPTTGIVAQQILGISNRIGKTADPATHFSNCPESPPFGEGPMRSAFRLFHWPPSPAHKTAYLVPVLRPKLSGISSPVLL